MAKKGRRTGGTQSTPSKRSEPALTAEQQFRLEYAYVIKDLRAVFILAAVMFLLLILLNLLF